MRIPVFIFALGTLVAASAFGGAAPALADQPSVTLVQGADGDAYRWRDGRWRHRHYWHRPYYRPAPPPVVYYPPYPPYYPPPPPPPRRPGFGFWVN